MTTKKAPARKAPGARPSTRRQAARRAGGWRGQRAWLLPVAAAAVIGLAILAVSRGDGSGDQGQGGPAPANGAMAPPVVLPATTGQTVDLAAFRGKRNVLLYFYEHAG
jgi:hypothetical protein